MTLRKAAPVLALTALLLSGPPAHAGNTLIAKAQAVAVAKSALTITPDREWNKMGARPGRNSETWTLDGDGLNDVTFYGGIETDRTLFREVNKRVKPLPRFSATMLLPDIPALLENSYRIALATPLMTIESVAPCTFAGAKGVTFTYRFTRPDEEVRRKGEGYAAIIAGKLYMATFEAPDIYYYDRDIASFRALAASARIGATPNP
ncbi:hypothetical protein [Sphingomonas sp. NFR15]|uniref:hypothetical protein n=1 Tax=Sphingomonas sp. NFR15 TaxID=1566282 RepID=UPI000884E7B4|nr:hypothetical protein [Sphingomonas sp. NFR15]SDA28885.1 hypothetical protein SAMN03159340_02273 [Sphingomonas sp. NFR15]